MEVEGLRFDGRTSAAHAAVRNLDVDVVLCPRFRSEFLPGHLAVHGGGIVGDPAVEGGTCAHLARCMGIGLAKGETGGRRDRAVQIESRILVI